ncbi:MAG: polymer-forming cytoskeletal protein [Lachnospiraceae bacterium]|nr:polymer-forming cytoskeletal protein [Lachnospiraceae bacterium]
MGFFTDLKEDISQAVNEVSPEEEAKETAEETKEDIDLDALLDNIGEESEASVKESSSDDRKSSTRITDETAVITAGMSVKGDISSTGSLEVLGSVNGNITINGKLNVLGQIEGDSKASEIYCENANITGEVNSQGTVKVGQSSVVIGNIFATSAVIAGAVKGDIDVKGPVVLDTSAIVMGNIKSKSVQINNGAVIEGICSQCYADVSPTSFFDEFKKSRK